MLDQLAEDVSKHNVIATVYIQSSSAGWTSRTRALEDHQQRSLSVITESEVAQGVAAMAESGRWGKTLACAGIIATAELSTELSITDILETHSRSARNFRGLR